MPPASMSWSSDCTLRVVLGDRPGPEARARVRDAFESLQGAAITGLRDIAAGYTTLQLTFGITALDNPEAVEREIVSILDSARRPAPGTPRIVQIPVCYEGEDLAPDLADLAAARGMSVARAVGLHTGAEYDVEFLGFSPGFAYLAGLPDQLATPRHATPRARVPAGSVGIAGGQTGVYPGATPGGWRIIGRTPLRMFDAARSEPSLLRMGDRVRFLPITRADFEMQGGLA